MLAELLLQLADQHLAQRAVTAHQFDQLVKVDQRQPIEQADHLLLRAVVFAHLVIELADKSKVAVEPLPQAVDGIGKAAVHVIYRLAQAQQLLLLLPVVAAAAGIAIALDQTADQLQRLGHVGVDVAPGFIGHHLSDQFADFGGQL